MERRSLTRRTAFAAVPALFGLGLVGTAHSAEAGMSDAEVMRLDRERIELDRRTAEWREPMGEAQLDAMIDRLFEIEEQLYRLPCTTMARAVAKLGVLGLSFERGYRTDETEEAVCAEIVAFLKGRA